jgi:superfamily II DNA/RNA helicase
MLGKVEMEDNTSYNPFSSEEKSPEKSKKLKLITSRGIDFPNVYCVINYDVPNSIDNYIYRIGRTGRLG